jgi:hypothetical protein
MTKEIITSILIICSISVFYFVNTKEKHIENNQAMEVKLNENEMQKSGNKLKIKVGEKTFTATILDNATAKAFKALLPLTLNMNELNENEKYAQLPKNLPTNASVPASIQTGDLMMYGSSTLVLFYESFTISYSYTKIGKIDNEAGLMEALGSGDIKVSFELQN